MSNRQKKLIVPDEGRLVPKPGGGTLARNGEVLALTSYWLRRERDGDVILKDRPKRAPKAAPKAKEAET